MKLFLALTAVAIVVTGSHAWADDVPAAAPTPTPPTAPSSRFFGSVFVAYDFSNQITASGSASVGPVTQSFGVTENISPIGGVGVSGEWNQDINEMASYGFELSFQKMFNRTASGATVNISGATVSSNAQATITESLAELNAKYYYGHFFVSGGVNYPFLGTNGPGTLQSYFGYQAGLGATVNKNWSAGLEYRTISASGSADVIESGKAIHEDLSSYTLSGVAATIKFSFR